MWINDVAQALTYFLAMLLALTFHEAAHAFVAFVRGDSTAKVAGRLSLNPAAHADLVGTIILPLTGLLLHMPILGWAKPVPVDERNFKKPVWDSFLVGMAGPASNLVMAFFAVVIIRLYSLYGQSMLPEGSFFYPAIKLLAAFAFVNAILAFFNLIPFPPLDGSAILRLILPKTMYESFEAVAAPYGFIILIILMMSGGLAWVGGAAQLFIRISENIVNLVLPGSNLMG
ncbi:MAG: site-2 protease family protein [Proteobacteria bacterium]|nr:site-2 protease family protein [Pseudomonadota bacterium]